MAIYVDDSKMAGSRIEIINPIGERREITHVIHDIDGTHSLIRDWPPVMSLSVHWAMTCGLADDFDSDENLRKLIPQVGQKELPETDRYCIECAGFSAITQMEFGIRRAIELGNVPADAGLDLTEKDRQTNSAIIRRIWGGEETFDDVDEPECLKRFMDERTPRLFKLYEKILNGACRDRNTAEAWEHPEKWRVPGSLEFMTYLHEIGCVNYFVTGAVVYADGGMFEEVQACGYEIGPGKMVEELRGSSWDKKLPKDEVMEDLFQTEDIDPRNALLIGDGRTEIRAGVEMGSVTMSRLRKQDTRLREIHVGLGVNYIVEDYTAPALRKLIYKEGS
jgi:hypothetical protein